MSDFMLLSFFGDVFSFCDSAYLPSPGLSNRRSVSDSHGCESDSRAVMPTLFQRIPAKRLAVARQSEPLLGVEELACRCRAPAGLKQFVGGLKGNPGIWPPANWIRQKLCSEQEDNLTRLDHLSCSTISRK